MRTLIMGLIKSGRGGEGVSLSKGASSRVIKGANDVTGNI